MMGRQTGDQSQLFYLFNLEGRVPAGHLLRRLNPMVTRVLSDISIRKCRWASMAHRCISSWRFAAAAAARTGAFLRVRLAVAALVATEFLSSM
jgi:hypothetical protein